MSPIGSITLIDQRSWNDLEASLREVALLGDLKIFPYQQAAISLRIVGFNDVYPISRYLLQTHLDIQHKLREHFLKEHDIDTLDLHGKQSDISFRVEGESELWHMAPPIVEISEVDGGKPLLVDGEHRFMLAHQLKKKIRVIWIENVPKEYPVVSLPLSWGDVQIFDRVPPEEGKRIYRFPEHNRHYFYYRDLSRIASGGIRPIGSVK